jgi:hypothetical protein
MVVVLTFPPAKEFSVFNFPENKIRIMSRLTGREPTQGIAEYWELSDDIACWSRVSADTRDHLANSETISQAAAFSCQSGRASGRCLFSHTRG